MSRNERQGVPRMASKSATYREFQAEVDAIKAQSSHGNKMDGRAGNDYLAGAAAVLRRYRETHTTPARASGPAPAEQTANRESRPGWLSQ